MSAIGDVHLLQFIVAVRSPEEASMLEQALAIVPIAETQFVRLVLTMKADADTVDAIVAARAAGLGTQPPRKS